MIGIPEFPGVTSTDGDGSRGPRVVVVSAAVGAGHDGPADEIERRMILRGWSTERYDGLAALPGQWGARLRDLYIAQMRHTPRLWGRILPAAGRGHSAAVIHDLLDRLTDRMHALIGAASLGPADVVVSTYPLVSQLLGRLRVSGGLRGPAVSFVTDLSVHPLWIHPGIDLSLVLHPLAAHAATALGAPRVERCAPALAPRFLVPACPDRAARMRRALGVAADERMALVTAGSAGTGDVVASAHHLAAAGLRPVVLCAHNAALRRRVRRCAGVEALAWTEHVPVLLAASDVIVQNAGGLASLEGLAAGRPVLSYRVLPGHGASNAAALDAAGLVPWARDTAVLHSILGAHRFSDAADAARQLFDAPDPADAIERIAGRTDHGAEHAAAARPGP